MNDLKKKATEPMTELEKQVYEIVVPRVNELKLGAIVTAEGIFGKALWEETNPQHHKVYGRVLGKLVAQRKLDLEWSGFTSNRWNSYQKI